MNSIRAIRYLAALLALTLGAAACVSDDPGAEVAAVSPSSEGSATTDTVMDGDTHGEMDMGTDAESEPEEYTFGVPMEASEASRVIEIIAKDNFSFNPKSIDVKSGEIITFRVSNPGVLAHDFTLGDGATQVEHEAEMAEMAEMTGTMAPHDEGNTMSVPAGETKELTWMFTGSDNLLFACHVPGHYAKGMVGTVAMSA